MGLLALGAPADEYETEISAVLARLPAAREATDVSAIMTEEFARPSGLDEATIRPVMEAAAPAVWEAIVKYRTSRRDLTAIEQLVLSEIQRYWGPQNTVDRVFFSERDEAVLFVLDSEGELPMVIVLTNIGESHRDGSLSLDALRDRIKGPGRPSFLMSALRRGLRWLGAHGRERQRDEHQE